MKKCTFYHQHYPHMDIFKSFEERGEIFKKHILRSTENNFK